MTTLDPTILLLTEEGKKKAAEELAYLKTIKRHEVSEKIQVAKEMGDISENAEYAAAKEEQGFVEARILELEHILKTAEVVSKEEAKGAVAVTVGSKVEVKAEDGSQRSYTIVGVNEADPKAGKVTNESPIGQALYGEAVGAIVEVKTPSGTKALTIVSIS
ncbi:transcription elongation factor GreA [Candidatus Uhrbacteria bacterium CG10_big_fil_rev_8_21_14_0_10_48_11]|uniref:Transcription elongation factor GreA n=1 Tax=Candidatus Uhrbacteria bacterium CG10_big_fil_rev_8_21_14_0_10_48_11 TaxID=1975037 RepID=A0A2M8LEB7_9BACT|nr:MAG: transcription elongation factor GreA [Candidatus Uhrbacteria bacterium CG10_big_fil_rev_8_21_14_0_10_48_11]